MEKSKQNYFSFYEAKEKIQKFQRILGKYGIPNEFTSNLKSVSEVIPRFEQHKKCEDSEDYRPLFTDFAALYDIALKVIAVENHQDFRQLLDHLRKLSKCKFALNSPNSRLDQDANKIIELYLATLCMRIGNNVLLDDPNNSKGNNPDVIASINKLRWAFACKTIHTINSQTIFEKIEKAISQIEKSNVEIGIPVINIKNILPYDRIWPLGKTFPSANIPIAILKDAIDEIADNLVHDIGPDNILVKFRGKKTLPGVIYVAKAVSSVLYIPTPLNVMSPREFSGNGFSDSVYAVIEKLNHYMQLAN
ncbi:MAG TPA: hypothetical protein VK186_04355 [Candidatus Deferrimicrobium sp.]|nr:hypothetical protein [Candidatus Deferrimicrobium sp.]